MSKKLNLKKYLTKRAGYGSQSGSESQWYGSADPDPYHKEKIDIMRMRRCLLN